MYIKPSDQTESVVLSIFSFLLVIFITSALNWKIVRFYLFGTLRRVKVQNLPCRCNDQGLDCEARKENVPLGGLFLFPLP